LGKLISNIGAQCRPIGYYKSHKNVFLNFYTLIKNFVSMTTGNNSVTFYELNSIYGHDTFLLDVVAVGAAVKVKSDFNSIHNL
jgi:hypothetical protein